MAAAASRGQEIRTKCGLLRTKCVRLRDLVEMLGFSLSPSRGEGLLPHVVKIKSTRRVPLTRNSRDARISTSPRKRGEVNRARWSDVMIAPCEPEASLDL